MADVDEMDLVREFAERNSEPAFAEIVERHIRLVYSVALRCVGNAEDAQNVTQAVFIIFAQKAARSATTPTTFSGAREPVVNVSVVFAAGFCHSIAQIVFDRRRRMVCAGRSSLALIALIAWLIPPQNHKTPKSA
jgi:hypothetical protein